MAPGFLQNGGIGDPTSSGINASGVVLLRQSGSDISYSTEDTNWVNWTTIDVWPITVTKNSTNPVILQFLTDLSLNSTNQYFIMGSDSITVDGFNYIVNINVDSYPGFIQNGSYYYDGDGNIAASNDAHSNITVQNITIDSHSSSLLAIAKNTITTGTNSDKYGNGWLCQAYFGGNGSSNSVANCSSNGNTATVYWLDSNSTIHNDNTNNTLGGCILGDFCSADVTNCYSTGTIGLQAGGIFGSHSSNSSATNCYSTGAIGDSAGGIFGYTSSSSTATNCYSTGAIRDNAGGIFGENSSSSTATNCYSTGAIRDNAGGIFGLGFGSTTTNCYYTNGSSNWSDTAANASLNVSGVWTSIGTNVPYLLSAFTTTLYDSAGTNLLSNYSYTIVSVNESTNSDITIDTNTGTITFASSLSAGTYVVNVLATNTNGGYSFGTFTKVVNSTSGIFIYQFDCTNTVTRQDIAANYLPINNDNNSITIDGVSVMQLGTYTYYVQIMYSYTTVTGTDGLRFNVSTTVFDYYNNTNGTSGVSNLQILDLATIPISSAGFQFAGLTTLTSFSTGNGTPYIGNNTSFANMFDSCTNLESVTFGTDFNTTNVTSMFYMFNDCHNLTSIDVSNFNTSNVTIMDAMFGGCFSLSVLDLSNFNTSQVTNMISMFEMTDGMRNTQNSSLNTITFGYNFNTSGVTDMNRMFYGCSGLTTLQHKNQSNQNVPGIDNWDTSQVTNMSSMFEETPLLITIGDVYTNWNVTAVSTNHTDFATNSGLIIIPNFTDSVTTSNPVSNVCFPAKTPVLTNQGLVNIEQIDPTIHTIRNKKIVAITKTVSCDKKLVCIAKNALGRSYPEKTTLISQNHKVLFQGQMIKATHLAEMVENVTFIPYKGEAMYNVLLEEHEKMQVNNLIVETLHPEHKVAKLYRFLKNVKPSQHGEFIEIFNKSTFSTFKKGGAKH